MWLAWERTREIADILDAHVIVFQCPKSFLPSRESTRNLSAFFRDIPGDHRVLAWEPRGDAWSPGLVRSLCAEYQLLHVVDPFQNEPVSEGGLYWRLHGKTGYRYRYTGANLAELRTMLTAHSHRPGPHYIMFNNIYSKEDALRFLAP